MSRCATELSHNARKGYSDGVNRAEDGGVTEGAVCRSDDPRVERTRAVVLAAAWQLLSEVGVERTTIENVAERSGVARSTIYRHWTGKPQLVIDALADVRDRACLEMSGDPIDALRNHLHDLGEMLRTPFSSVLCDLMATAERDPELANLHHSFVAARRRGTLDRVEELRSIGRVRDDISSDWLVDLAVGPLMYRRFSVHQPMTVEQIDHHIDALLALAAPAASSLPVQPPASEE